MYIQHVQSLAILVINYPEILHWKPVRLFGRQKNRLQLQTVLL